MKRLKLCSLAAAVLLGVVSAFASSKSFSGKMFNGNVRYVAGEMRVYLLEDISGMEEGVDFVCDFGSVCNVEVPIYYTPPQDNNGESYVPMFDYNVRVVQGRYEYIYED